VHKKRERAEDHEEKVKRRKKRSSFRRYRMGGRRDLRVEICRKGGGRKQTHTHTLTHTHSHTRNPTELSHVRQLKFGMVRLEGDRCDSKETHTRYHSNTEHRYTRIHSDLHPAHIDRVIRLPFLALPFFFFCPQCHSFDRLPSSSCYSVIPSRCFGLVGSIQSCEEALRRLRRGTSACG